jgi:hypothetical protein
MPMLKGEVDPLNQMIVEAARVLFPNLYAVLRSSPNLWKNGIENVVKSLGVPPTEMEACRQLSTILLQGEFRTTKPVTDPRYHDRYFSFAVALEDISDAEMGQLLGLAEGNEQLKLDEAIRTMAKTRLASLIERIEARSDTLAIDTSNCLAIALTRIGDLLPIQYPIVDHQLSSDLAALVAKLARQYMTLREHNKNFVAPQLIESTEPLPLALAIFPELRMPLPKHADNEVQSLEELDGSPSHNFDELRAILHKRISADARAHPPYKKYLPKDALRLLQIWHDLDPKEEMHWLETRLQAYPAETVEFLKLYADQTVNYQFIRDLANPVVVAQALVKQFADALTDHQQDSPDLRIAREFLYAHHRAAHTSDDEANRQST